MFTPYNETYFSKFVTIAITNACNKQCGGCSQLIPQTPKNKIWFISPEEFQSNIEYCFQYDVGVWVFGGEPTIHPHWKDLCDIMATFAPKKIGVLTNGVKTREIPPNVYFKVDSMDAKYSRDFYPTLVAPQDVVPGKDYWSLAKQHCHMWHHCAAPIYRNQMYYCEIAAAMDYLLHDGKHGWPIDLNQHPLMRTEAEIKAQADIFCRRCGWCIPEDQRMKQDAIGGTLYTLSNTDLASSEDKFVSLEIKKPKKQINLL